MTHSQKHLKDQFMYFTALHRALATYSIGFRHWLAMLLSLQIASASGADVLFVSNYIVNSGNVSLFDYDGSTLAARQVVTSNVNGPSGLALDSSGNLFLANVGVGQQPFTSKVASYVSDSNGDYSYVSQFSDANMNRTAGMVIGTNGYFYLTNLNGPDLAIYDQGRVFQGKVDSVSGIPRGLAFNTDGFLYIAVSNNQIAIIDVSNPVSPTQVGTITNTGGIEFQAPHGIIFDVAGRMLVSNYSGNSISILEKSGSVWTNVGKFSGNMNGPWGMDFDSSGNLFVANFSGNSISKFIPSGPSYVFAASYSTGITAPSYIKFHTVVPEPSSILLVSLGICVLILNRRKHEI